MPAKRRDETPMRQVLRPGLGLGRGPGFALARHEFLRFVRRLALLIAALAVLVLGGAAALSLFEDVSYWRGLTWALDTVATVGSIPNPDTLGGEITKVVLISFGVGTMFFALVTLTELFVAGDLSGLLEAWRMERKIAQLENHYLICGFGRVGRQVARDLRADDVPFVVIDDNPDVREMIAEMEVLHVDGRAGKGRHRARRMSDRLRRLGRREHLRHAHGPSGKAGHPHRRPGRRGGFGTETDGSWRE